MTADEGEATMVRLAELIGIDNGPMKFGWPAGTSQIEAMETREWGRICVVCDLPFGCHEVFECPREDTRPHHERHKAQYMPSARLRKRTGK